ncbi:choice-of-anchor E domain-containing protein [Haloferula sargassicola]|uniref:PEP-CTERM protein-sorting domain-containing protein n=1 Tax=Haloferula sargassicola TaxID=490096 RepID=A0ABP9UPL8_9BACT
MIRSLMALFGLVGALCAQTMTLQFTGDLNNGPSPAYIPGLSQSADVPLFDPALGQLVGVKLLLSSSVQTRMEFENDNGSPVDFTASLSGTSAATFGTLSTNLMFQRNLSLTAGASDDVGGVCDWSGIDYIDTGLVAANSSASTEIPGDGGTDLAPYIGPGTLPVYLTGSHDVSMDSHGDVKFRTSQSGEASTYTVIYTYVPVPEPSGVVLLGLSGVLLLARRRR